MKLISVMTPCFNEQDNVRELYAQIKQVFATLPEYRYEHIFIDNASSDNTVAILRELAASDPNVKVIVNARNFGHIRSPYYALLQARGDAVISMASDLQDPPALISEFLKQWEAGYKAVVGIKSESAESPLMYAVRSVYYRLIGSLSDLDLLSHFTGFGLYDRVIMDVLRKLDDPYPYFRGLIAEIGFPIAKIPYRQPARVRGITKNNFYTLYDLGMLGITSYSKVPLRLATMLGFSLSVMSLLAAIGYFVAKLLFWYNFPAGIAPMMIVIFFFFSVQLFFTGLLGEYIAVIHTQVMRRPLVVEKERINWDAAPASTANHDEGAKYALTDAVDRTIGSETCV